MEKVRVGFVFFFFNVSQSVGIALGIVLGAFASQAILQTRLFSLSWLSWRAT